MKTPSPEHIRVSPQSSEGFVYKNLTNFGEPESAYYTFEYSRPFMRPHSISLGAGGIVTIRDICDPDGALSTAVHIVKGYDALRANNENNFVSRRYSEAELLAHEVPPGRTAKECPELPVYLAPGHDTLAAVAQLAVADALVEYSQREHWMIDLARTVMAMRRSTQIPPVPG